MHCIVSCLEALTHIVFHVVFSRSTTQPWHFLWFGFNLWRWLNGCKTRHCSPRHCLWLQSFHPPLVHDWNAGTQLFQLLPHIHQKNGIESRFVSSWYTPCATHQPARSTVTTREFFLHRWGIQIMERQHCQTGGPVVCIWVQQQLSLQAFAVPYRCPQKIPPTTSVK